MFYILYAYFATQFNCHYIAFKNQQDEVRPFIASCSVQPSLQQFVMVHTVCLSHFGHIINDYVVLMTTLRRLKKSSNPVDNKTTVR